MKNLSAKNVLIVGNGISGKGADYALDKLGVPHEMIQSSIAAERINLKDFDLIVISPGISLSDPIYSLAEKCGVELIGELELGYRINEGFLIAVTGTNGKTTTVRMISSILSEKYKTVACGNVGVPFSTVAADGDYEVAVVEVSSFQMESARLFHPNIAVITNISEDHLNRHKNMAVYAALKEKIAENQTEDDYIVLSQDGISIKYLVDFNPQSKVIFTCLRGKINGAYVDDNKIYYENEYIVGVDELPFSGAHNLANFLSAVAVVKKYGIKREDIIKGIQNFREEKHRVELIAEIKGVRFYDDSKGTNVAATVCALKQMSGSVCLIAGGSDKNCPFDKIFSCGSGLQQLNLIGDTKFKLRESAYMNGFSEVKLFDSLESAVKNAYYSGCKNILLSPACASFDMFNDYVDRANAFIAAVNEIQ